MAGSNILGRVGAGRRAVIFAAVAVVVRRRRALAAVVVVRRVLIILMAAVVVVAALVRSIASIRVRSVGRAVTWVLLGRRVSVARVGRAVSGIMRVGPSRRRVAAVCRASGVLDGRKRYGGRHGGTLVWSVLLGRCSWVILGAILLRMVTTVSVVCHLMPEDSEGTVASETGPGGGVKGARTLDDGGSDAGVAKGKVAQEVKKSFGTKSGMSEAVTRDSDALAETV